MTLKSTNSQQALLIDLLNSRNRCLQKMRDLSANFVSDLSNADLVNRAESLENKRGAIIKAIDLYNRKIDETVYLLLPQDRTPELTQIVKNAEQTRERLFSEIVKVDATVAQKIQAHCEQLNAEFNATKRSQEQVSRFRSQWVAPVGEELDSSL